MAAALAVVTPALLVVETLRHSDYVGDDIYGFFLARTTPFWAFLFTPIDVHYVPLYRLVFVVLAAVAPMRHAVGVFVIAALYGLTAYAALRFLRRVVPSPWPVFLLSLLAANVCLGALFVWFVAGLHRLPYLICTLLAMEQYVQYRQDGLPRRALTIAGLFALSLGFFSKTLLWPVVFCALELALTGNAPNRRPGFALSGALAVAGAVVAVVVHRAMPEGFRGVNLDPLFQLEFLRIGTFVTLGSLLGFVYFEAPWQIALVVIAVLLAVLPRRSAWRAWAALALVVTANVWIISVPLARSAQYGLVLAWASYRYYFELAVFMVVFGAIAWAPVLEHTSRRTRVVAAALLVVVHVVSFQQNQWLGEGTYAPFASSHRYLNNLRRDVAERAPTNAHPLEMIDAKIPREILSWGELTFPLSLLFTAMAVDTHFGPRRDDGLEVADDGHLVPYHVARDRRRKPRH